MMLCTGRNKQRAAVINYDATFTFLRHDQALYFATKVLEDGRCSLEWEHDWSSTENMECYVITIRGPWAQNLVNFAEIAADVDADQDQRKSPHILPEFPE